MANRPMVQRPTSKQKQNRSRGNALVPARTVNILRAALIDSLEQRTMLSASVSGPAPLAVGVSAHFDFGTALSPLAAGYTRVTEGTTYTPAQGFGWQAGTIQSFDRGAVSGSTALTEDGNYTTDGTFAYDIANGTYAVTLTLGDVGPYAHDYQDVLFQGSSTPTDTVSTAPGQVVTKTYSVTVTNGQLDLRLRDIAGNTNPAAVIEALDINTPAVAASSAHYDFGTSTSPVAAGYTRVTGATTYSAAQGFGYQSGTVGSFDTGLGGNALTQDFNYTNDATFATDLANGTYDVTVNLGDLRNFAHDQMGVYLNGQQVGNVTTAAGQVVSNTYTATVTNGELTVRLVDLGGTDPNVVIESLDVTPHTAGPKIVSATPVPSGTVGAPQGKVRLTFDQPIQASTFTTADVTTLSGPGGAITPTGVVMVDDHTFDVTFAPQSTNGTYTLTVGPNINNNAGTAMDQNGNSVAGETPGDQFTTTFTISSIANTHFDFGTAFSPVAAGYNRVTEDTAYSAAQGYGWLSGTIQSFDTGLGSSALTQDFNYTTNGTFAVDLANGTYDVTVNLGDLRNFTHDQMGVYLEDGQVDNVTTAGGQVVTKTYTVTVADGQLDLRLTDLGGADPYAVIESLDIGTHGAATPTIFNGSGISTGSTITVPAGGQPLTFVYNLLTATNAPPKGQRDFAYVSINGVATLLASQNAATVPTNNIYGGGFETGFKTATIALPAGTYKLGFGVTNVGASTNGTTLLLDDVKVNNTLVPNGDFEAFPDYANFTTDGTTTVDFNAGTDTAPDGGVMAIIQNSNSLAGPPPESNLTNLATNTATTLASLTAAAAANNPNSDRHFDFGTATSPVATGYTPVTAATTYTVGQGYGWIGGTVLDFNTGIGSNPLLTDFNYTKSSTFAVDIANGTYTVTVYLGDTRNFAHSGMGVSLEGTQVDTVSTTGGQVVAKTYTVNVTDGQLDLGLAGLGNNPYAVIEGLDIVGN